ncbi:hypothetical protein [Thalassospira aquimaris]|uniref:Uncharacterized protein n=1 Tax=Thalassospira aquimaris TaxID=3037796 RepID=A0ABT6GH60_9PROT|nr:hypothetical protein [Thalassospira sp. FZY0004]MDG4721172.1 hypothetical protein [Thalassospira sp. FZY0004]
MPVNPRIVTIVKRINNGWPQFPLSNEQMIEFENRLDGLDPHILDKAVTSLIDTVTDRKNVTVNRIKVEYSKFAPVSKSEAVRPQHFYDRARDLANRERGRIIANCKPLFDQIKTRAGQAMLREYLQAATWVMAQGVIARDISKPPRMAFDRAATGYMVWTSPTEDLHEARELYRRGQQLGRIDIEVPGRAMECFKRQTDKGFGVKLDVKRVPSDEFEKEQQFHEQGAVA